MAELQLQAELLRGQEGDRSGDWSEGRFRVPSHRLPTFTLFRYARQSVSAWDHSPQRVGPKLGGLVLVQEGEGEGMGRKEGGRLTP